MQSGNATRKIAAFIFVPKATYKLITHTLCHARFASEVPV